MSKKALIAVHLGDSDFGWPAELHRNVARLVSKENFDFTASLFRGREYLALPKATHYPSDFGNIPHNLARVIQGYNDITIVGGYFDECVNRALKGAAKAVSVKGPTTFRLPMNCLVPRPEHPMDRLELLSAEPGAVDVFLRGFDNMLQGMGIPAARTINYSLGPDVVYSLGQVAHSTFAPLVKQKA